MQCSLQNLLAWLHSRQKFPSQLQEHGLHPASACLTASYSSCFALGVLQRCQAAPLTAWESDWREIAHWSHYHSGEAQSLIKHWDEVWLSGRASGAPEAQHSKQVTAVVALALASC